MTFARIYQLPNGRSKSWNIYFMIDHFGVVLKTKFRSVKLSNSYTSIITPFLPKKRYFLMVSPWNCRINTCNHAEQEAEFFTIWCGEGKVTNSLFARPFAIATIFKRRSKWRHDSDLTRRKKWWEKMGSDGLLDVCWISSTMLCKGNLICFWWFSTKKWENI